MEHRRRRVRTHACAAAHLVASRERALPVEEGRGRHGRRLGAATARAHAHMRISAHPCARVRIEWSEEERQGGVPVSERLRARMRVRVQTMAEGHQLTRQKQELPEARLFDAHKDSKLPKSSQKPESCFFTDSL